MIRATLRPKAPDAPLPCPDPPVCIIGDIHGRLDLLDLMLAQIAARPQGDAVRIICVGDVIDRGSQSAAVLARLMALTHHSPDRVFCLMGNHERMMLDFLEDPEAHGPRWIAAGGAETLSSFGISPWTRQPMATLARALQDAMGAQMCQWLGTLPLSWSCGTLGVTHAGADPALPFDSQSPKRLMWGTRAPEPARTDGMWIAQGHTSVQAAYAKDGHIMVDTGAWHSGELSAAWLDAEGVTFLAAQDGSKA